MYENTVATQILILCPNSDSFSSVWDSDSCYLRTVCSCINLTSHSKSLGLEPWPTFVSLSFHPLDTVLLNRHIWASFAVLGTESRSEHLPSSKALLASCLSKLSLFPRFLSTMFLCPLIPLFVMGFSDISLLWNLLVCFHDLTAEVASLLESSDSAFTSDWRGFCLFCSCPSWELASAFGREAFTKRISLGGYSDFLWNYFNPLNWLLILSLLCGLFSKIKHKLRCSSYLSIWHLLWSSCSKLELTSSLFVTTLYAEYQIPIMLSYFYYSYMFLPVLPPLRPYESRLHMLVFLFLASGLECWAHSR